jgi:hypothetical protein
VRHPSPAWDGASFAVASDGQGTTLIVYERHPGDAETPIRIGLRVLKNAE